MARLILWSAGNLLFAALVTLFLGIVFPDLLDFEGSRDQMDIVLVFFIFCGLTLWGNDGDVVFGIINIPVLTQFLHLFEKYDFPAGANSIWRLFPFMLIAVAIVIKIVSRPAPIPPNLWLFLIFWILYHLIFLSITPQPEALLGGSLLIQIALPVLIILFFNAIGNSDCLLEKMEQSLVLAFVIMAAGTFGLVLAGANHMDSVNLLVTRNIADTNVTMAYFILLWPFILIFTKKRSSPLLLVCSILLFLSILAVSFSRGAMLLVLPFLTFTLIQNGQLRFPALGVLTGCIVIFWFPEIFIGEDIHEIRYAWNLRLEEMLSGQWSLEKLSEISGRAAIRESAYDLFLQNPLTGHGTGSFELLGPGYREAHSLLYTVLAEQGLIGAACNYTLLIFLGWHLIQRRSSPVLVSGFFCYVIFNHTVGSVLFILPRKSLSVNCIAPIILICYYYYTRCPQGQIPLIPQSRS